MNSVAEMMLVIPSELLYSIKFVSQMTCNFADHAKRKMLYLNVIYNTTVL